MKKRIIYAIPAILIMIMIFCFSSQPSEESNKSSDYIVDVVIKVAEKLDLVSENEEVEIRDTKIHTYTFIVRKLAHTLEYAILGVCLSLYVSCFPWRKLKKCGFTLLVGFLYASSDEWHQSFVPGRSCEFRDVLIDTNGVFLGILVFSLILWCIHKRRSRQIDSN